MYALVYGTMPFDGRNFPILTKQITTGNFCKPAKLSGNFSFNLYLEQLFEVCTFFVFPLFKFSKALPVLIIASYSSGQWFSWASNLVQTPLPFARIFD